MSSNNYTATLRYTSPHFTKLHFTTLIDTSLPLIVMSSSGNTPLDVTFSAVTSLCVVVVQMYKNNSVHYNYFVFVTD